MMLSKADRIRFRRNEGHEHNVIAPHRDRNVNLDG
jgi:hypothetical protein